jgi:uncharacterized protein (UPF0335 family)
MGGLIPDNGWKIMKLEERVARLEEEIKRLKNKDVQPDLNPFGLDGCG